MAASGIGQRNSLRQISASLRPSVDGHCPLARAKKVRAPSERIPLAHNHPHQHRSKIAQTLKLRSTKVQISAKAAKSPKYSRIFTAKKLLGTDFE